MEHIVDNSFWFAYAAQCSVEKASGYQDCLAGYSVPYMVHLKVELAPGFL